MQSSLIHMGKTLQLQFFWKIPFTDGTEVLKYNFCITSGVSAGQTIPHKVLCNCLGFASLPSLPIGEFKRRKWESVEAKVRRFNT